MKNEDKIKILEIDAVSFLDYPDNENLAVIIFVLGCDHNCEHCHNPELKNFNYLNRSVVELTLDDFKKELKIFAEKYRTNKIVLTGGDPLHPDNITFIKKFLDSSDYEVCIYTGYSVDYARNSGLSNFKFLKCGKYDLSVKQLSKKTDDYIQFSSKNQKLYDMNFKLLSRDGKYYFMERGD